MKLHSLTLRQFLFLTAFILLSGEASANTCKEHFFVVSKNKLSISKLTPQEVIDHHHSFRAGKGLTSGNPENYGRKGEFQKAFDQFSEKLKELIQITDAVNSATLDKPTLVLGLGGSPSPIIALMNEFYPQVKALELPLSVAPLPQDSRTDVIRVPWRMLTKEQLSEVLSTWEKFLPLAQDLQGQKILLLDFASSAESLLYSAQILKLFYQSKGFKVEIETFAFHEKGRGRPSQHNSSTNAHDPSRGDNLVYFKSPETEMTGWSYQMPYSLARHFINQDFKVMAQYPSYTPLITPLESLVPRQDYKDFRGLLKDLLRNKSH